MVNYVAVLVCRTEMGPRYAGSLVKKTKKLKSRGAMISAMEVLD